MSNPWTDPGYVTIRCDLDIDGVQASVGRMVPREIWAGEPGARAHVEHELRFAVAEHIVTKLAPPVYEMRDGALRAEAPIGRAEALRLAKAHTSSLMELASRLEAAGEYYALADSRRAVEAGRLLVAKLESDEGRLPVRPGEEPTP